MISQPESWDEEPSRRPIDPECRLLRPLAEYTTRLPSARKGKRLNRATLWRWSLRGVRGRRLHTVLCGGSRMTCDAWVWEFLQGNPVKARTRRLRPGLRPDERRGIARALGLRSEPGRNRNHKQED